MREILPVSQNNKVTLSFPSTLSYVLVTPTVVGKISFGNISLTEENYQSDQNVANKAIMYVRYAARSGYMYIRTYLHVRMYVTRHGSRTAHSGYGT